MEAFIILGSIFAFLMLGTGILVVFQVSGFVQAGFFRQRQNFSNSLIQQFMVRIALAQSQLFRRSKELEILSRKLSLSNQELGQLNEMKSKFLSMVVHDVRTPLASIQGYSEILLGRIKEERDTICLNNIVGATQQLARLISDLTDLAMIEAGKLKMEKVLFDYGEMPKDILPGIEINATKKNIEFIVRNLPEGIMVNGDKFRLSQVLMNLLNNAIKFTPAGKRVELYFRQEGKFISTYVKDSGIGVHPSETKKIFGKLYQSKYQKDEKLRRQGWGLGLAIAQEVVLAHKGEIGVSSPGLGKGSTFWFKIPISKYVTE